MLYESFQQSNNFLRTAQTDAQTVNFWNSKKIQFMHYNDVRIEVMD